ncbi:MAG TPA: ornithine carbamoyltransferase [Caldisericia bacterium]|nr:ornithine carbamoyltransferase [Caldisericia bacterium]
MPDKFKGRDFISIHDFTSEEITFIFETTKLLKIEAKTGTFKPILKDKNLAMIFQKSSTRTRVSFEIAMNQLGGKALFLSSSELQLRRGETIADTARVLARYVDGIMARVFSHNDIIDLAKYSDVPVINGLSDFLHPCQAIGDFFTILEKKGSFENINLTYIGDSNNVSNSLMLAAAKTGVNITICSPKGYEPKPEIIKWFEEDSKEKGARLEITNDPIKAVENANFIYTDVWASMGQEDEHEQRIRIFSPYQVNSKLMSYAPNNALVMHCLPAHRGEEITDEVMDSSQSIVFDEAENRLHAQKAILALIL